MSTSLPVSVAIALCANPAVAAAPHAFTVHDMLAMQRISEPRVSPDGKRVVFVVRTTDMEENKGRTSLWLVQADGGGPRRLTTAQANDDDPRWSPDGMTIYFLSTRSGTSQVWRIPVDGGEAEQVTNLPLDAKNLLLSRDGRHMALTMEVFPGGQGVEGTRQKLAGGRKTKEHRARL
jgi:dipeptidyl aminopeptidase/acylaminoacyl peptidase